SPDLSCLLSFLFLLTISRPPGGYVQTKKLLHTFRAKNNPLTGRRANIQRRSLFPNPERLRIGCSGWSYQDWVGPFYPRDAKPGDYLKLYSNVFNAVEIDSTYYRTPSPLMVANWRKITPEAFVFTAKFPKKITHELKLRDSLAQLERYYKSISELREKLGALLIQLPPSFNYKKDKEALEIFVGQIDTKYKHAIEFRNKSWFKPDIYKLLES